MTEKLAGSAGDMTRIADEVSQGVQQQQSQTDQVATAMNEMTATVQEVARHAEEAAGAATNADSQAADGNRVVSATIAAINKLAEEVEQASGVIHKLEQDSENIGAVLTVIKSIAEQTNLLALNAAIEAARAGDQGRGFAVVADEVRTLASRTQKSTEEIESMIEKLQQGARNAVSAMDGSRSRAQTGVDQAAQAGKTLSSITEAVATITHMNNQIATAANEQSAVAEEINRSIVGISEVAEMSAASAVQTANATDELSALAVELRGLVNRFRL
jgi:methyl-accepting chemotaxis protein